MVRRMLFLTTIVLPIVTIFAYFSFQGPSTKAPSIVLIVVDTLRADKLGILGSNAPASNEFDDLARDGVVFTNALAQASWTRASMASMLTGAHPVFTGVRRERWDALPDDSITLAERLKERGFTTIGLTANPQLNRDFRFDQGFDHYAESTMIFGWMKDAPGKVRGEGDALIRTADEMFSESLRLIDERKSSGPLYLQVLIMDVHAHHRIKPEEVDSDLQGLPDAAYLQAVRRATRPLAQFIKDANKTLAGNVTFVITADHGEGLQDHPSVGNSRGHGNLLYRSHLHVPLVFIEGSAVKRFLPGTRAQLTQLMDVTPTIMELTGGETSKPPELQGHSLVPILKDAQHAAFHTEVYAETIWRPGVRKSAIVTPEWLYIRSKDFWEGTAPDELHPYPAVQDGARTSVLHRQAGIASQLAEKLDTFYLRIKP